MLFLFTVSSYCFDSKHPNVVSSSYQNGETKEVWKRRRKKESRSKKAEKHRSETIEERNSRLGSKAEYKRRKAEELGPLGRQNQVAKSF